MTETEKVTDPLLRTPFLRHIDISPGKRTVSRRNLCDAESLAKRCGETRIKLRIIVPPLPPKSAHFRSAPGSKRKFHQACLRGRTMTNASKRGSEKVPERVLGRVLRRGLA